MNFKVLLYIEVRKFIIFNRGVTGMTINRKILGIGCLVICLLLLVSACKKPEYQLKLLPNNGQGQVKVVSSSQEQYQVGTKVVLDARAAEGWKFASWAGAITGTINPKTVVMKNDLEVKANFVQTRAMAGGGLDNKGSYASRDIEEGVALSWTSQADYQVSSSPVVVNNTVYLGSKKKKLYALNSKTGQQEWEFNTQSRIISTPAVNEGTVYFGTAAQETETGWFYAVDAESGQKIWQLQTEGAIYYSSPKFATNTLYFGDKKGNLYAVNSKTGQPKWKFEAASAIMYSTPAVTENNVVIGTVNGELYAVNKETGNQEWTLEMDHPIVSSPISDDNMIYYVSYRQNEGLLAAVNVDKGTKEWEVNFNGPIPYAIALQEDSIYVGTLAGELVALNLKTQEKKWSFSTPGEIIAAPITTENIVYVGDSEGNLYGINNQTGQEQWSFSGQSTIVSAPVIAKEKLYYSDQSGMLYCLNDLQGQSSEKNKEK